MLLVGLLIFVFTFLLSYAGVSVFYRWSVRRAIYDHPNERSSHTKPTPRGGGLVVVTICLLAYTAIGFAYPQFFSLGYFTGAAAIAVVSWLDDLHSIPFIWRLAVHMAGAALVISDTGVLRDSTFFSISSVSVPGFAGGLLTFVWIVWLVNAYNFMDGIDGIAALQAIVAAGGWTGVAAALGMEATFLYAGILALSCAGFLLLNWQPAKIFMGDVGSAFLGFTFAAVPLLAARENSANASLMPFAGAILVWFFLFDTGITIVRRLLKGRRIWTPHREHLYQRLVIQGLSHGSVTALYGGGSIVLAIELVLFVYFRAAAGWVLLFSLMGMTVALVYLSSAKKELT